MIAILLAATLQFGTVKSPVATIDVDHPKLEEVATSATAGITKTHIANADIYVRVPKNTNRDDATIDVVICDRTGRFPRGSRAVLSRMSPSAEQRRG